MRHLVIVSLLLLAASATAQTAPDFTVDRDTTGFYLLQADGSRTRFDTAFVAQSLRDKSAQEAEFKAEADLIERLLVLRRSLAIAREEKTILQKILKKCAGN
jgi:hypothetical protein